MKLIISYLYAISFIIHGENDDLFEYWKYEIIRKPYFSIFRLLREKKSRTRNYLFWWRLANEMYKNGGKWQRKAAKIINRNLQEEYGCDLGLGLTVGKGLQILHHVGIIITSTAVIGENLTIRQNTTIGRSQNDNDSDRVFIGNNVDIGAHTFILGSKIKIGNNVKIGAMSFVNKDIPDNSTYITKKQNAIISIETN